MGHLEDLKLIMLCSVVSNLEPGRAAITLRMLVPVIRQEEAHNDQSASSSMYVSRVHHHHYIPYGPVLCGQSSFTVCTASSTALF